MSGTRIVVGQVCRESRIGADGANRGAYFAGGAISNSVTRQPMAAAKGLSRDERRPSGYVRKMRLLEGGRRRKRRPVYWLWALALVLAVALALALGLR